MIQAVGIEQISEDSPMDNLDVISKFLNLPVGAVKRKAGPVDLLITTLSSVQVRPGSRRILPPGKVHLAGLSLELDQKNQYPSINKFYMFVWHLPWI